MNISPAALRQVVLVAVAIPVILGWSASLVYYLFTHDIAGLSITTPLIVGLLTFATGFSLTRKSNGSSN